MSNITNEQWIINNNTKIDAIKAKANSLPDANEINEKLDAQDTIIAGLQSALEDKSGLVGKPNIFVQITEPEIKKGLWLQTNKTAEHYKSDDSIYFSGTWSNDGDTANIPYSFSQGSAVAIGTDIYVFGSSAQSLSTNAYKYDTLTDTYTQLTDIPYDFGYGSAVAVGTDIYLLGNYSGNLNKNYKYDTLTDTYTQRANIPRDYQKGSAVAVGTDIYLLGGYGNYTKYVNKYDTLTNTWTQLADLPSSGYSSSAVVIGTDIFVLGSAHSPRNKNYKYNILTDTWTSMTNIPYQVYDFGMVAIGTDIYLLGGNGTGTSFYKYNVLTDTYTQLTNIPYSFYQGSAVVVGTDIYLLGGSQSNTKTRVYHFQGKTYNTDNTVIIAQGRASTGKTYNTGYTTELFDTNFDENFKPLYGLVDAWFYTTQDGIILDIPTYYGNGTNWINFKNPVIEEVEE